VAWRADLRREKARELRKEDAVAHVCLHLRGGGELALEAGAYPLSRLEPQRLAAARREGGGGQRPIGRHGEKRANACVARDWRLLTSSR